jgi:MGT family glycosyltransferase
VEGAKRRALARNVARLLQETYLVKKPSIYEVNVNFGDLTLVYTSKFFHPFSNTFDSRVKFVGPSILPRPEAPAFPFEQLTGSPLIYASLGTLFTNHLPFFRACVEAFAESRYQVVMSLGSHVSLENLGPIPANFIVQASVPQLEILQRASLFITHGGMNSASEAMYYGVPLLVIPQAQDQFYVAKRVTKLKAGDMLFMNEVDAQRLSMKAGKILADPVYAQNSAKVGETFHAAGGYMRAADEIAAFKQSLGILQAQRGHESLTV